MKYSFLRMIAFTAIAGVAFVGCQKEELNTAETGLVTNGQAAVQQNAEKQRTTITVNDVVGEYKGTLDKVVMRGRNRGKVLNQIFTVSKYNNSKFSLHLPPFKVGEMPGTIEIDAKGIKLNSDGTFKASNISNGVLLTVPILGETPYPITSMEGSFTPTNDGRYKLQVGIHSEGKIFFYITIFTAYVHFEGDQQQLGN